MSRRVATLLVAVSAALLTMLGLAGPAVAAPSDKPVVLSNWTQTSSSSYSAWNSARQNQGAWAAYGFDWSTDYCSSSPDNPLGFDFTLSCYRHDFGYRNYKRQSRFNETTRLRIDNNFKSDMYKQCGTNWACKRTADLYYAAVREFGGTASSTATSIQQAGLK